METPRTLPPWFDVDPADLPEEQWRDIPSYDGYYQVSSLGRVKSLRRLLGQGQRLKERILSQRSTVKPHACVQFSVDGVLEKFTVLQLVVLAFLPDAAPGKMYYHRNKNGFDNRLSNVVCGSREESARVGYELGVGPPIDQISREFIQARAAEYERNFCHLDAGALVAKVCTTCLVEQPISEFYTNGNRLRRECKGCALRGHGVMDIGKHKNRMELAAAGLRICSDCKLPKSLDQDFSNNKKAFLGKTNTCKACAKIRNDKSNAARAAAKRTPPKPGA